MRSNGRIIPPFITDEQLKEVRSFLSYKNNNIHVPIIRESFDFSRALRNLDKLPKDKSTNPLIGQFVHCTFLQSTGRDYLISTSGEAFKAYKYYFSADNCRIKVRNELKYKRRFYGMIVADLGQKWIVQGFTGDEAGRHMWVDKGDMDVLSSNREINFMKLWIRSVAYKYYIYQNKPTPAEQIAEEASHIYGEENVDLKHYLDQGYLKLYKIPSKRRSGIQVYANRLIIKMEDFYISNRDRYQHKMEEFYIIIYFSTTGYMKNVLYGFRGIYEYKDFKAGYIHSHMHGYNFDGGPFCMGDSTLYLDMEETRQGFDIENISLILYQIEEFVKWENMGNPHLFFKDIEAFASESSGGAEVNYRLAAEKVTEKYPDIIPQISVDLSGEFPQVSVSGEEDLGFRLAEAIREDSDEELIKYLKLFRNDGTVIDSVTLQQARDNIDELRSKASRCSIPFRGEQIQAKIYINQHLYGEEYVDGRWILNPNITEHIIKKVIEKVSRAIILQSLKREAKNQKNYEYKKQIKNSNQELFGLIQVR